MDSYGKQEGTQGREESSGEGAQGLPSAVLWSSGTKDARGSVTAQSLSKRWKDEASHGPADKVHFRV